ncbi:MAG: hypothetical protein J3R72DRAFT_213140 [Linnemannia gamsii]|nr:MAG: hypothetical protein J3R72DRAFT_213140 [Linnemannia gamsii]
MTYAFLFYSSLYLISFTRPEVIVCFALYILLRSGALKTHVVNYPLILFPTPANSIRSQHRRGDSNARRNRPRQFDLRDTERGITRYHQGL